MENAEGNNKSEILVVVSKMKDYIQKSAGMNTSGSVAAVISEQVRKLCDDAAKKAAEAGRKTVMDRDFTDSATN
jgi:histone H3/H4